MKQSLKERLHLSDNQWETLVIIGKVLLLWCLIVLLAFFCTSCRSIKTEVQYEYRDSVITHHVIDTTHVTVFDTTHVESSSQSYKDDELEIQFGSGGGTYNAQTGEATNVSSVHQKSKEKELQNTIITQAHTIDYQSVTIDSLRQALTEAQGEEHTEQNTADIKPRSGWDRFCTWWTIGTWVALLLLLAYGAWRLYRKFWLHV